jgi:hypothetical protein
MLKIINKEREVKDIKEMFGRNFCIEQQLTARRKPRRGTKIYTYLLHSSGYNLKS